MTYEESYRKCGTLEELEKKVNEDLKSIMVILNPDRAKVIKESAEKVANEKFGNIG